MLVEIEKTRYKISFSDILNNSIYHSSSKCNWYNLWCRKIDYYEYQMEEFKKKYPILYESFPYYCGLTENAISLINNIDSEIDLFISHKRLYKNENNIDFYNPVNLILDSKVRDICEYLKNCFFYDYNPLINIKNYVDYNINNSDEAILFLSRMLYPSYYFDMYDEIIKGNKSEISILDICNKSSNYEKLLVEVYNYLLLKYIIPEIEWLKKM